MNNSIPYLVKKEDTLASIAKELGITNPNDLRHYHNMNAGIKDGIGPEPLSGKTLLTPSPEKIKEINAKRAEFDGAEKTATEKKEEEKQEQTKQQQEEKKQDEQKEKETAQSAHENKYFVVHGALCCCDKAENPKQTAKLLVTSHSKVVLNAEAGKFFATEVDKTFDPAAATFGKCKLKPSSGGNQPCMLVPAPKWTKVFEKTQVFGNKVLTEISTLDCTIGGKIEVAKYGQTDTIMKEHAENTNQAALALINPAIKMPILETAYPSVSNITLKSLKDKPDFKPVSSTDSTSVKKVIIRQNDECNFLAKIKSGNVNLTSWVIYDGCTGDKDKRLFTEEQLGTSFKYTFSVLGKYRVEGYGKPKKEDFRGGIFNKNYPDCSIDIEVVVNKLDGPELVPIEEENFAKIIGGKMRLRQNFPASFKAKFLMTPTDQELENLKMYVTDALGNLLKSTRIRNAVSFIPLNTKAQYRIIAEYKLDSGEKLTQSFTGETISNSVSQITHDAAVIRPGTPMTFAVKASTFSLYIPDEKEAIAKEVRDVKWNLNGRLMGNGKSITLPGNEFMNLGKYVVEAYVTLANAYGKDAKHEDDDWHFEVKENDVITFSYNGIPKVGKTTQLVADQLVFPDLPASEMVVWDTTIPYNVIDKNTIAVTPLKSGKEIVKCRINRQPGKALSIDVKQAKVLGMLFTDSNGIEIEKSSWYQTVNIWVKQEHLIGEDLTVEIWDNDAFKNDYCKVININNYDGNLIPLTLDSYIKGKAGNWGMLFVKIGAPKLKLANVNNVFESKNHLDVEDKREIYSAQIGTQDAKQRHYHVDYNQVSYFYGKSRGIKAEEKLKITIYENGKKLFEVLPPDVKVDTSGVIQATLKWDIISQKLPSRAVYAVVQDAEDLILYNGAKTANGGVAVTKSSALLGLAEYKSAVLVKKSESNLSNKDSKNVACECEARVRAFLRTIKEKEGFAGDLGYETNCGGKSFIKDYGKDWSKHPNHRVWIERIKDYSNAAGAYQIMEKTWSGMKEKRLWYGVTDFKPLNQDKFALILLKYKRLSKISDQNLVRLGWDKKYGEAHGDIIKAILDNDLDKAILISSLEWASLPGSPYGQEDKKYTTQTFKDIYNVHLKEELNGISDLKLKKGFLRDFGYSHCIPFNALDGIATYRIYSSGGIEKHIPKKIKQGCENQYKYVYHDSDNIEHEICTVEKNETIEKQNGKRWNSTKPNHSEIISDTPVSEGQTQRRVKYVNGDIAEYGINKGIYFWNLYRCAAGSPSIELVKMPDSLNNTKLQIKYVFSNTQRRYTSPGALAGFIGALAECKFLDIQTTGSCFKEGTCFPSVKHVNGQSIDTLYISKDKETKFISAMTLFKFTDNITGNDGIHTYENTKNKGDHNDHLHSGFDESSIIIIKQK